MQSSIISSSRSGYVVPALLLGTAFFIATACSAQALTADQYASMEGQLKTASAQLSQFQASRPAGSVLGASTTVATEVPVRPVCRVSIDKKSYVLGDTIKFSWKTTGGSKVELVNDVSGKDALVLPQGEFKVGDGFASIPASVLGNPIVTLKVTSKTGHSMTCARVVPIVAADATQKDSRLAPLQAQLIQLGNRLAALLSNRESIDQKMNELKIKELELMIKIEQVTVGGSGHGSSTPKEKSVFELTNSTETILVNNSSTTADDSGKFDLKFKVTAIDTDVVVPAKAARVGSTTEGVLYQVIDVATGKPAKKGTYTAALSSSAERTGTNFVVNEGETEEFTVAVIFDPAVTGSYKVQLHSVVTSTSGPKYTLKPAADFSSDALLITN